MSERGLLDKAAGVSWRFLVVVGALVVAAAFFGRLFVVVVPLIVALLLAAGLEPLSAWLRARMPRGLVGTIMLLLAAALLLASGWIVITGLIEDGPAIGSAVRKAVTDIGQWAQSSLGLSTDQVGDIRSSLEGGWSNLSTHALSGVVSGVSLAAEIVGGLILSLILFFFFAAEGDSMWSWVVDKTYPGRRGLVDGMGRKSWETLAAYVRGTALVSLTFALMITAGLLLLRVHLAPALGVLSFVMGFIPILGALIAGAVAVLVTLAEQGEGAALIALILVLAVHQLAGSVIGPKLLGERVNLHPAVVLLAVTGGGAIAGILGAFVAVPVTALIVAAVGEWRRLQPDAQPEAQGQTGKSDVDGRESPR